MNARAEANASYGRSLTRSVLRTATAAWAAVSLDDIASSWAAEIAAVEERVARAQALAVIDSNEYIAQSLYEQGLDASGMYVPPVALVGMMPESGAAVSAAFAGVAYHALGRIGRGMPPAEAKTRGFTEIVQISQLAVTDTARTTARLAITGKDTEYGWVRTLTPPSCPRCVVLAGRFYDWNRGFPRHPQCDCRHVPAHSAAAGAQSDPYAYFESLTEEEQNRGFGKAQAQAIRDGGDIYQVVNEALDRTKSKRFTRVGTGKRGFYRTQTEAGRAGKRRLTVPEIYHRAGDDRTRAKQLLSEYGYLLDEGQVPGGAIRGDLPGLGQFGRGGTRIGASAAVRDARRTGTRDPRSVYTMTAEELREYRRQAAARYTS